MHFGPDKSQKFPNKNVTSICFIKNEVNKPNVVIGDYTYYNRADENDFFEKHITHYYDFLGDKLIIEKFCQIASGVEFIMNGANYCMSRVTTYPFYTMANGGENTALHVDELPFKGDTIIENDIWIGQNVTIMPGIHIGNGAISGANSVVAKDIPAYHVVVGNPCKVVKKRFSDELINYLEKIKWWEWNEEKIFENL